MAGTTSGDSKLSDSASDCMNVSSSLFKSASPFSTWRPPDEAEGFPKSLLISRGRVDSCSCRELTLSSKSDSNGGRSPPSSVFEESLDKILFLFTGFLRYEPSSSPSSLKLIRFFEDDSDGPDESLLHEDDGLASKGSPFASFFCDGGACLKQYIIRTVLDKLSKLIFPSFFSQVRQ